jgi:uncharacterized protein (UPF0335 family)
VVLPERRNACVLRYGIKAADEQLVDVVRKIERIEEEKRYC